MKEGGRDERRRGMKEEGRDEGRIRMKAGLKEEGWGGCCPAQMSSIGRIC